MGVIGEIVLVEQDTSEQRSGTDKKSGARAAKLA